MNKLLNKKGISEVISYVLLIVIALGISSIVYVYITVYLPKDQAQCSDEVGLTLENVLCIYEPAMEGVHDGRLNITMTLENKGLKSVDGAYLRLGKSDRKVKSITLNKESPYFEGALKPGIKKTLSYTLNQDKLNSLINEGSSSPIGGSSADYSLEFEPAITTDKGLALCTDKIITRQIYCGVFNVPTTISISAPTNGQALSDSNPIDIVALVNDNDALDLGAIQKVEVYEQKENENEILIATTEANSANIFTISEYEEGIGKTYSIKDYQPEQPSDLGDSINYKFIAKVTDLQNRIRTAEVLMTYVKVIPPIVALTSPTPNSEYQASTPVTLSTQITELRDGNVIDVEYYLNGNTEIFLGKSNTEPYSISTNLNSLGILAGLNEVYSKVHSQTKEGIDVYTSTLPITFIVTPNKGSALNFAVELKFRDPDSSGSITISSAGKSKTCNQEGICNLLFKAGDDVTLTSQPATMYDQASANGILAHLSSKGCGQTPCTINSLYENINGILSFSIPCDESDSGNYPESAGLASRKGVLRMDSCPIIDGQTYLRESWCDTNYPTRLTYIDHYCNSQCEYSKTLPFTSNGNSYGAFDAGECKNTISFGRYTCSDSESGPYTPNVAGTVTYTSEIGQNIVHIQDECINGLYWYDHTCSSENPTSKLRPKTIQYDCTSCSSSGCTNPSNPRELYDGIS
ncbi:hypothetical protein COU54_01975 [Candidatus Pacearchaeota archaeon CG10_big_fil_rev_8_21_14_0_10_31_24]|nr:MAG: hypothetical protein COU54_01975 [Candidatus Pacearchaeota archaeon CG10_big_fil_rev_8_21_14_0_10_31_24]